MADSKKEEKEEKGQVVEDSHDGNQEVDPIKQAADEAKAKEGEEEKSVGKEEEKVVAEKEAKPDEAPEAVEKEEGTSDEEQKLEHAMKAEEEIKALEQLTSEEQKKIAKRLQKQLNFNREHPHGVTLLARDNQNNRRLFPNGPFGTIDVVESDCHDGICPHYSEQPDAKAENAKETPVHMLIAAFRDKLCSRTLHYAFTQAENPSRLFIRVIDQVQPGSDLEDDAGCWELYCEKYNHNCKDYKSQVRIVKIDSAQSMGPTYARSKLSAMVHWDYINRNKTDEVDLQAVNEQDYCMQIDSHMNFSKSFDTRLIEMHHRTKNDYAVLSTYVTDIESNDQDERTVPNLCMVTFTGSIRNWGTKECKYLVRPKLTNAMWGAGLSFHRCHGELVVPVDPYLDNVFDGEEGSRGIRFFTHGYDVYTPDIVLVTHDYKTHQGNPVVHTWGRGKHNRQNEDEDLKLGEGKWKWSEEIEKSRPELSVFGTDRVNMLLGIGSHHNSTERERKELDLIRNSRFGLGTKRTMEQVREFTGIDLLNKKMESNKCGNNFWVQFEESSNYGVQEVLARGNVGKVLEPPKPEERKAEEVVLEEQKGVVPPEHVEEVVEEQKGVEPPEHHAEEEKEADQLEQELQEEDQVLKNALKQHKTAKKSKKKSILMDPNHRDMGRKKKRGVVLAAAPGDYSSPDDLLHSNRFERAKHLLDNAKPQMRHAAEVLKTKEEALLAGAVRLKEKEAEMISNGKVDYQFFGFVSVVVLLLCCYFFITSKQGGKPKRDHKKRS